MACDSPTSKTVTLEPEVRLNFEFETHGGRVVYSATITLFLNRNKRGKPLVMVIILPDLGPKGVWIQALIWRNIREIKTWNTSSVQSYLDNNGQMYDPWWCSYFTNIHKTNNKIQYLNVFVYLVYQLRFMFVLGSYVASYTF